MFRRVVVGVSGGVDSAVSALLLKRKGFDVCGAFMVNWDESDEVGYCTGEQDWLDAQFVCRKIGIDIVKVNFVKDYWNNVFRQFLSDYENGLTPNPDILCNKYIKFNEFFKYATSHMEADAIATGHYAQSSFGSYLDKYKEDEKVKLLRAVDEFKDQTFFLSCVPEVSLRRTMFPVGILTKEKVKQIATEEGLCRIARKKESTGICFIGERNFQQFINEYIDSKPGNFVDIDTEQIVGHHNGIHHWTIGQRCRLSGYRKPYFIAKKDLKSNDILVAAGTNHPALLSQIIFTSKPFWINEIPKNMNFQCKFRFQHTKPLINCTVKSYDSNLIIHLDQPLRAITPGQYAVLYSDRECLGNARILDSYSSNHSLNDVKRLLNQ